MANIALDKYRIIRNRKLPLNPRIPPAYVLQKKMFLRGWVSVHQFNAYTDEQARHFAFKWLYRDEDDFVVWEFTL